MPRIPTLALRSFQIVSPGTVQCVPAVLQTNGEADSLLVEDGLAGPNGKKIIAGVFDPRWRRLKMAAEVVQQRGNLLGS